MSEPIYLNDWAESKFEGMCRDFVASRYLTYGEIEQLTAEALEGPKFRDIDVLIASCCHGEAFVLFRKDGKLFEVNGNHCSRYGLDEQWQPEETTIEALEHRLKNDYFGKSWSRNTLGFELTVLLQKLKEAA